MDYYIISTLINFTASLLLGFILLLKNPRNGINRQFSAFAFIVALWSMSYYFWQTASTPEIALGWIKTVMSFAIFIPVLYLHFVYELLKIIKKRKTILAASYGIASIFLLVNILTDSFIRNVQPTLHFAFWPVAGPIFYAFFILWGGLVCYATYLLYHIHKNAVGREKLQMKYVLWGMVVGFIGGATNYFLWFGIPIAPFGNVLVSVYVAMTAYSIVKHRLLDIRLVIARSVAYLLLVIILATIYAAGVFGISYIFFKGQIGSQQAIVYTILALFIAFTFQPLKSMLEKMTDKIFFKGKYDSNTLLLKLSTIMATTIDRKTMAISALNELSNTLHISRGVFILFGNEMQQEVVTYGYTTAPTVTRESLQAYSNAIHMHISEDEGDMMLKQRLIEDNITILLPLYASEKNQGILLLGEKKSGEIYSDQDIQVLTIFAPEIAVALQNTRSYEEIKRFNITLIQEVDKATLELRHANNKLTELDKLKDDFVSVASHELRTPMTAIKSYLWMALHKKKGELSGDLERYLSHSYESVERLINLVNDMLNVSRIEAGSIELRLSNVDVIELAKEVLEEVLPKAEERGVTISVDETNKVPLAFCDKDKVHEVYLNLIGNSLKFTPSAGRITIDFLLTGDFITIRVKDTGRGIAQDDLAKLFSKFSRLDNSYVMSESTGTGLGLFISKSLIALHKGEIKADSEGLDKGATFMFTLPIMGTATAENLKVQAPVAIGEAKGLEKTDINTMFLTN